MIDTSKAWHALFDKEQNDEITAARAFAEAYPLLPDRANWNIIIAKMADLLDQMSDQIALRKSE